MSPRTGPVLSLVGFDVVQRNWGWFLALGIVQIVLGTIALGESVLMTIFSVVMLGWLLIIGGISSIIHAFVERRWNGFIIELLTGLFYGVAGFMMVANPGEAAVTLTLVISVFLMIGGIFRIVEALVSALPHRGWVLLNGVVTLALGILIWRHWPSSGLNVIGLFVGIEMVLYGWSLVMLAIAAKNMPTSATSAAQTS
jgi:uncharacterized membrane protein HdeD (DUF308 family)